MSDTPPPGATPTGFQRTLGGGFRWSPPPPEELGRILPAYEIECLLGRGGMGAVYKGFQSMLDRSVAIKILPPDLDDQEGTYAARFKNEARLMAKMDHPAIVAVHDFGETSGRQLYFVMAFIDGTDVSRLLAEQGRLPAEHALAVTAHVCDALSYAHALGVVHRDIKPANILINYEGQVKVTDFGLAKASESLGDDVTKTGLAVGTPDYLAPEALGSEVAIDGRADLYAVGVMLYQMLTGQLPRGAWKPASTLVPGLDERFDEIIDRAMQANPTDRYQSAAEMRRDLDVILTTPRLLERGDSSAAIPKQLILASPSRRVPLRKSAVTLPPKTPPRKNPSIFPWVLGTSLIIILGIGVGVMVKAPHHDASSPSTVAEPSIPPRTTPSLPSAPEPAKRETSEKPQAATAAVIPETPIVSPVPTPASTVPSATVAPKPEVPALKPADPAPSDRFPPGQWVRLFETFEDLPEELRSEEVKAGFSEGWLAPPKRVTLPILKNGAQKNVAVRLKLRGSSLDEAGFLSIVALRYDDLDTSSLYGLRQEKGKLYFARIGLTTKKHPEKPRDELFPPQFYLADPDQPWAIEFGVVGERLIARHNGTLLPVVTDPVIQLARAPGFIATKNEIRDIEVVNLDGLPETEALHILGIDEKGTDLRAIEAAEAEAKAAAEREALLIAAIPELNELHLQFQKLLEERVEKVFRDELAALDANYLGGLQRTINNERQAGHLDAVLSLEAEKEAVSKKLPVPAADASVPESLAKLRVIYHDSLAKIEERRVENIKAITRPLGVRLKQLESSLTKQSRVDDAKFVRSYGEELETRASRSNPQNKNEADQPIGESREDSTMTPAQRERAAAEWVLSVGGSVTVIDDSAPRLVRSIDELPKSGFTVSEIKLVFGTTERPKQPFANLAALTGLAGLKRIEIGGVPLGDASLAPLASMPKLESVRIDGANLTDEAIVHLAKVKPLKALSIHHLPKFTGARLGELTATELVSLVIENCGVTDASFSDLAEIKTLERCSLVNLAVTDAVFPHLSKIERLNQLTIRSNTSNQNTGVSIEGLAGMKNLRNLKTLGWDFVPGKVAGMSKSLVQSGLNLSDLEPSSASFSREDIAEFGTFPQLRRLVFSGPKLTDEALEGLPNLPNLKRLELNYTNSLTPAALISLTQASSLAEMSLNEIPGMTDEVLEALKGMKSLRTLNLQRCTTLTEAAIEDFEKVRPDVQVVR